MNEPKFQIKDWDKNFENYKSRERDRCGFVCIPNKQGGVGLTNVLEHPDGGAIYGIWALILQLCSKQKKPRDGWLTDTGRADGRPLSCEMLSRLFRRPVEEVRVCLQVVSSLDVGWVQMAEGDAEWLGENTLRVSAPLATPPVSAAYPPATPDASTPLQQPPTPALPVQYPLGIQKERNERKEGNSAGRLEVQHAETQLVLNRIARARFNEQMPTIWPGQLQQWLDDALPLTQEDLDLLEWFYISIDADHQIFQHTKRRQSFWKLIEHLRPETQKIRSARSEIGLNGINSIEIEVEDWTPARRDAAGILFGRGKKMPPHFQDLPGSARSEVDNYVNAHG